MPDAWTKHYPARNVAVVTHRLKSVDDVHHVLMRTDAHHDNPHCDWDLERKHLEEAVRRDASIVDAGDIFCAMQGKYDKRSDKSCIRPEHQAGDYLDALVRTAADFYEPYADRWVVFGRGNHEQSIRKRHETDLIERLAATITDRTGHMVQAGGYTGWVRFSLVYGNQKCSVKLWYAHGWGGGGPVTMGTIQAANRMVVQVDGADIQFSGHVHEAVSAEKVRVWLDGDTVRQRTTYVVIGSTYKDEYGDGYDGWHVETGKAAALEGFGFIGIEQDAEYAEIASRRIGAAVGKDMFAEAV